MGKGSRGKCERGRAAEKGGLHDGWAVRIRSEAGLVAMISRPSAKPDVVSLDHASELRKRINQHKIAGRDIIKWAPGLTIRTPRENRDS